MFAFNARLLNVDGTAENQYLNGNAEGQYEQHDLTSGGIMHMEIFYMEFQGNDVWLIGEITKSINTNATIGHERAVRLQDNGEGKNAPLDERSKLYKRANEGDDWDLPLSVEQFDLIPLEVGNIQIR